MNRLESLALAISNTNGGFVDPDCLAFKNCNPGLLRSYRPEKKVDDEHYRVFTSCMGGFKALLAYLNAKCSGQNSKILPTVPLSDLLSLYGFKTAAAVHKVVLFVRRAIADDTVSAATPIVWFTEETAANSPVEMK